VRTLAKENLQRAKDTALLGAFSVAAVIINLNGSLYEHRVALVSLVIVAFSYVIFRNIYKIRISLSNLGSVVVLAACAVNVFLASARAAAALAASTNHYLSIGLWDPVFFIGSIGTLFAFSIGYFIIGSSLISDETRTLLEHERLLTDKLNMAIEDQKNLQKLLIHEIKRPINAIDAALQANTQNSYTKNRDNAEDQKLRRHIAEASTILEGIGEYEELSALFENPNKMELSTDTIAEDLKSKWRITVHVQDKRAYVQADRILIDIALGNLIENAQKFGRTEKGVSVTISSSPTHVIWDVIDDGPGIPKEEWKNVWAKFYRIGTPSHNAVRGCGLGLHAVKSIAEIHDGYSEVRSQTPSVLRFALPKQA
jgi:signal transduction histidine kinase